MEKPVINYETLIRLTRAIPTLRDPEEIALITVEGLTHALKVKGCSLFLFNPMSHELEIAGSFGLSREYLDKGPISAIHSIASSLSDGQPVAIYDVSDDPRIQYPEEAVKEGISSMLSVPIIIGERIMGCMRIYTTDPWEFSLEDVNFVQAMALIVGMALEMSHIKRGYRNSIDILKDMRDPRIFKPKKQRRYESIPGRFPGHGTPPPMGM